MWPNLMQGMPNLMAGFNPMSLASGPDYNAMNQQALMGTMLANRGGGGGGGGGGAYYNYLGDIYGADRNVDIANIQAEAQRAVEEMRGGMGRDVANIQGANSRYGDDTRYDIAGLQDATNRYGIDATERLGNYRTGADIYGAELGYDAQMGRNANDRYGHDVEKYGLDVGREVAGMREQGETGRARIGASQGALSDILRDNRRGQVMGSPLVASMLGTDFQGLMGGAMNAMNGTPGAATGAVRNSAFAPSNPYDSNSTVAALLSQITGNGQPAVDYPRAGNFQASAMPATQQIAQRPGAPPAPTPGAYPAPARTANYQQPEPYAAPAKPAAQASGTVRKDVNLSLPPRDPRIPQQQPRIPQQGLW